MMKRKMRTSELMTKPLQSLAAEQLAKINGGATAIEYGLALRTPPPPTES